MLPYDIAFDDDKLVEPIDPAEIIFNTLLTIDIVLSFFSAYIDNEENVVTNHKVKYSSI